MINLALIGVGAWGKNYIATSKKLSDIKIKYICAASDKNLRNFQGDFIKVTNYKELFTFSDIDGVIIATPNNTHHEISYEFLKRGFNVLVEKPMSEDYSLSKKLLTIVAKNKTAFQVGHVYLFDPAYLKAKELAKTIGNIRYIDFEGTSYGLLRKNTSALWDIGSHAVSLCLDVYEKIPSKVSAWATNLLYAQSKYYDITNIKITFNDGNNAFIRVNWLFPEKRRKLVIVGEKDSIMYDAEASKKIIYYKDMIPKEDLYVRYNGATILHPSYDELSPLENEINEFVKAIKKQKIVTYSGLAFGLRVTKVLNLAQQSIEKNGKPMIYTE